MNIIRYTPGMTASIFGNLIPMMQVDPNGAWAHRNQVIDELADHGMDFDVEGKTYTIPEGDVEGGWEPVRYEFGMWVRVEDIPEAK